MDFYWFPKSCQIKPLSQLYEDVFAKKTRGTFVEVGAFDGVSFSNTIGLVQRGWHGHSIEPVKHSYELCYDNMKQYDRVAVHNLAIGNRDGEAVIHLGGCFSTMNTQMIEIFKKQDWASDIFRRSIVQKTKIQTLDHFLEEHNVRPYFDVLVIDVEGYEWPVLEGFSIHRWKPTVIIIELEEKHEMFHTGNDQELGLLKNMSKCSSTIESHGYELRWSDHINSFYVRTG